MMSETVSFRRQWLMLRTVSARGVRRTVKELAGEFGCSSKTVQRDLQVLGEFGFSLRHETGPHGKKSWWIETETQLARLVFSLDKVLALYLGRQFLEPLAGTYFWDGAHRAFQQIRSGLGETALRYLHRAATLLYQTTFRYSDYSDRGAVIDNLTIAIEDSRIAHITYKSARSTEPLTYDVYPYGLAYHRGSLYLVAKSNQHSEVRTFKVDRISDIAVETMKFTPPKDFGLEDYFLHSLGVFHSDDAP